MKIRNTPVDASKTPEIKITRAEATEGNNGVMAKFVIRYTHAGDTTTTVKLTPKNPIKILKKWIFKKFYGFARSARISSRRENVSERTQT